MYSSDTQLLRGKSLSTANPNPIKIGKSLYRGEVEIQRLTNSDMTIINVLPLEEYLYGVVPNEIGGGAPSEALKAQAVAARTYAYMNISKHSKYGFGVCNSIDCQVYNGLSSEIAASNKAVDDTANMVVTYNGNLAETVFFASDGGHTEDNENVWGGNGVPYLRSVEDKYESGNSYNYTWSKTFTLDELTQKFASKNIGKVTSIEITKYSASGRPIELYVK
jgi:stage II sporulation protein D